jgi:hypothetical protein
LFGKNIAQAMIVLDRGKNLFVFPPIYALFYWLFHRVDSVFLLFWIKGSKVLKCLSKWCLLIVSQNKLTIYFSPLEKSRLGYLTFQKFQPLREKTESKTSFQLVPHFKWCVNFFDNKHWKKRTFRIFQGPELDQKWLIFKFCFFTHVHCP